MVKSKAISNLALEIGEECEVLIRRKKYRGQLAATGETVNDACALYTCKHWVYHIRHEITDGTAERPVSPEQVDTSLLGARGKRENSSWHLE